MSCPEATSLKKIDGKDFCCIDGYDGEDACMPLKDIVALDRPMAPIPQRADCGDECEVDDQSGDLGTMVEVASR